MADVDVHTSGPVFDGRADAAVHRYLVAAVRHVAERGRTEVVNELRAVIRHPTPYYWTRIQTERATSDLSRSINDSGIIYGPWLEGTGSRNATTRFKGYSTFRRTTQVLRRQAPDLAEQVLPPFLTVMRGG